MCPGADFEKPKTHLAAGWRVICCLFLLPLFFLIPLQLRRRLPCRRHYRSKNHWRVALLLLLCQSLQNAWKSCSFCETLVYSRDYHCHCHYPIVASFSSFSFWMLPTFFESWAFVHWYSGHLAKTVGWFEWSQLDGLFARLPLACFFDSGSWRMQRYLLHCHCYHHPR